MKRKDIEIGMRVFRQKTSITKCSPNRLLNYGVVVSEAYEVPNSYRGLWKVDVLFDIGKEAPVPLNLLRPVLSSEKKGNT